MFSKPVCDAAALAVAVAVILAASGGTTGAQIPVAPEDLARLKADYLASRQATGEAQASRQWVTQEVTGVLTDAVLVEPTDNRAAVDLYTGLRPTPPGNGFWYWVLGGSEVVYWALDDGKMGPGAAAAGGGHVTEYEFSFGLHADFAGDKLRPFVIVSFYNAPFDPVGQATNPVVEPPAPVSSVGWIFDPITLPAAGFYSVRSGLIDLVSRGLDFDLDETFYVEILPAEWSSYPAGSPIFDPDVFAVFTGPGTVTYGANQDHMWSDLWCLKGGCNPAWYPTGNLRPGDGNGFYNHPSEMYDGGCSPYLNQSGIKLRGLECMPADILALGINEPDDICVKPGETVTVTLSQSCLPGLVRGYQAFLSFNTTALTFVSGSYIVPLPYGLPIIDPIAAVGPDIDVAAGIDNAAGQQPTSASADLVTLTFMAGPGEGLTKVVFRGHEPPTRFSNELGEPVVPTLFDSPDVCVDGTPPVLTCPADLNLQCAAGIPAPAGNYAELVAQGGSAVDNGCWGPIAPVVTHEGDASNGGTGCPASPLVITRTYRATDCADNGVECVQVITVIDDTPPVVTGCPDDVAVTPAAGACEAEVTWTAPTVNDNCDPTPTVEYLIDLGNNGSVEHTITVTTFTFPVGTHRVTVEATDACDNVNDTCWFLVTVNAFNDLVVNVELEWAFTGTRCITFELWDCGPPLYGPVEVKRVLTFSAGLATAALIDVPCDVYTCITARDELHTLRRTAAVGTAGTQYTADFTGPDKLLGGNLNDDRWIDVLDFGVYTWQWGTIYAGGGNTDCTTPYPHADIALGFTPGLVALEDFVFIQVNFLKGHEANCCFQPGDEPEAGPITGISVEELVAMGMPELAAGDLNGDGWLSVDDIAAFMQGVRPKPPIQTEAAPAPVPVQRR